MLRFWLRNLIEAGREWFRRRRRRSEFKGVIRVESGVDPTRAISAWHLVVVGPVARPKWLRFQCPCRCGQVIALPLMESHRPHWAVVLQGESLSLHPSVDATSCGSHFWIKKNRILWVD